MKMNQRSIRKVNTRLNFSVILLTIFQILTKIQKSNSQIREHLIKNENNILMKSTGSDNFIGVVATKTKLLAISNEGRLFSKSLTVDGAIQITPVRGEIILTNPVINFKGKIDCWTHIDKCVICGIGGCYSVVWSGDNLVYDKTFFHKKYIYKNQRDYVFDVVIIDSSNFFVAVESMEGENSAGLVRYDVTSDCCYKQWSPKLSGSTEDPDYEVEEFEFTKTIAAMNKKSKDFFLLDFTTFANPLVSAKLPFDDQVVSFEHVDPHASLNVFIVCGRTARDLCALVEIQTSALRVLRRYRQRNLIASSPPAIVSLTVVPMSQMFIVGIGKMILIFETGTVPTNPDSTIIEEYGFVVMKEDVQFVEDRLKWRWLLVIPDPKTIQFATLIKQPTSADTYKCHEGCHPQGGCADFLLRGAECRPHVDGGAPVLCNPGGNGSPAWAASNFNDGVKCLPQFSDADKNKIIGGFLSSPSEAKFDTNGQLCFNKTYANTPGENPNDKLKARANSTIGSNVKSTGLSTWAIIGIIAGILLLLGLIAFLVYYLSNQNTKTPPKQQFYMYNDPNDPYGLNNPYNNNNYNDYQDPNYMNNFTEYEQNKRKNRRKDKYKRGNNSNISNSNPNDNSFYNPNNNSAFSPQKSSFDLNKENQQRINYQDPNYNIKGDFSNLNLIQNNGGTNNFKNKIDEAYDYTNNSRIRDPYPYSTDLRNTPQNDNKNNRNRSKDNDNKKSRGRKKDFNSRPRSPFLTNITPNPFKEDSVFQGRGTVLNARVTNNAIPFQSYIGEPSVFNHTSNGNFEIDFESIQPKMRFNNGQADPLFNQVPPGRMF